VTTPIVIKTATFAMLVFVWAWAPPALAQVRCDQPSQTATTGTTAAFDADFTQEVTLPLINHDAGRLGPVLWAYIAGQACAESLKNMTDEDGSFKKKSGLNLWNTQKDYRAEECDKVKHPDNPPRRTIVGCLEGSIDKPHAASKDQASIQKPCWYDENEGALMQFALVCFPKYSTVEDAADKYEEFRPDYTNKLRELAADDRGHRRWTISSIA
jgi:hypothetical protein